MDIAEWVKIIAVAIVAAFVKEIASALFSLIQNLSISSTIKTKVKKLFTINTIVSGINFLLILNCAWALSKLLSESTPPDRAAVFNIALNISLIVLAVVRIEIIINQYFQRKSEQLKLEREAAAIESLKEEEAYRKLQEITERVKKLVGSDDKEKIQVPVKSTDA